ncbi:MAG: HlyD family efflux transporter periplasmic adaptor subunit [Pseudomonadota bacterium]
MIDRISKRKLVVWGAVKPSVLSAMRTFGLGLMVGVLPVFAVNPASAEQRLTPNVEKSARALVKASARVEYRTDLIAVVRDAPHLPGMRFEKGDRLVAFNCNKQQAELESARAQANGASIEYKNKKNLRANGAAGRSEVRLARAALNKAWADVKALKARMFHCEVEAPFAGRVVELNVRQHEMPNGQKPFLVIIDDSALELEMVLSSAWLRWLDNGRKFAFTVDETGRSYEGSITRLGAEVDPVSQTVKAFGRLDGSLERVLAGMSGVATFRDTGS